MVPSLMNGFVLLDGYVEATGTGIGAYCYTGGLI